MTTRAAIDQLIINSPYEEPARYWSYDRETRLFTLEEGRRPASYTIATEGSKSFDDPGKRIEIPLVNQIRPRVKRWREAGYPGITGITRRLLEHWYNPEERDYPFFFCQLEAIETLIWLTEAPDAEKVGIEIPPDGGPFQRLCSKMATGTGKTVVMAKLIAWQILNKVTYPQDSRFSKYIFIIAPGLTVKSRLQVLATSSPECSSPVRHSPERFSLEHSSPERHSPETSSGNRPSENYYEEFNIVPSGLREKLRVGKVIIHNWHKLGWETEEKIAKKKSVDKRGPKSNEAYSREVLGDMAKAGNIVVINDEAHHAWRVPAESKVKGVKKEDIEEATIWMSGLDRIHTVCTIIGCYDFSATPFAPSGKKSSEEALFNWIVSDFGLNDAIESGLVKTPRVVIRDDGVPDAKTYKSKLYHIYEWVKDDLNRKAEEYEPLPDLVSNGYYLLGKDWLEAARAWETAGHKVPPVMITVANRTETAARIKYAFDHKKILIDELCDTERILHIDSKVLEMAEAQEEPTAIDNDAYARDADAKDADNEDVHGKNADDKNAENGDPEDDTEDVPASIGESAEETAEDDEPEDTAGSVPNDEPSDGPSRKLTKKKQAELLRQKVDTVGQIGKPGQKIQKVISVGMLSEGWDAKTVTHIMGLRAFSSQLLCEQVVGRGLRRTSYEINPDTGLFEAEYVNIFGVPFTFLPHESTDGPPPPPPPPKTCIEPVAEKQQFEISWPNVIRIDHMYKPALRLDMDKTQAFEINACNMATLVELAPIVEGKPDVTRISAIDLEDLGRKYRMQRIIFATARDVYDQMRPNWKANKEYLLVQIIRLVEEFIASDKIRIYPQSFQHDDIKRRILITLSMNPLVHHIWGAIRDENTESIVPVFDREKPIKSTADMRTWHTSKPCEYTERSHVNFCVFDSTWEATTEFNLDRHPIVDAWVKNDHLGFEILYIFKGVVRKYRPDFIIRLKTGSHLIVEVKGKDTQQDQAKREFLKEWVEAVNGHGGFGKWKWALSKDPADIVEILETEGKG